MEICVVEAVAYLLVALQVGGRRMVLVELVMLLPAADPHHEGCGGRAKQPASGEEAVHSSITDDELDSIEFTTRSHPACSANFGQEGSDRGFASDFLDGVLGPQRIAHHT